MVQEHSSYNLPFVRFADDFLIFTPSKKAARNALACAAKGLKNLDLQLNNKKTKIAQSGPWLVFLGRRLPKTK